MTKTHFEQNGAKLNPPSSADPSARRIVLVVIWIGFLFLIGTFCLVAAFVADARASGSFSGRNPLTGPLAYLPLALPAFVLPLGLGVFHRLARRSAGWSGVQTGFVAMLGVFSLVAVAGFALFFAGASMAQFFGFQATATGLMFAALWRLVTAWPRP